MANREKSIELLNKGVAKEIETVLQYLYFQFHFEDKGYTHLSKLFKNVAIKEMMHIDMLSDRILFLKGDIIMKPSTEIKYFDKVDGKIDFDVNKILRLAEQMEADKVDLYKSFAKQCAEEGDSTTKRLFETLIETEEEHQDTFDIEGDNFDKFGDTYLALQSLQRVAGNDETGHEDVGMS